MTTSGLIHILLTYRYWVLFPAAIIEGPIITVIAGALISFGYMDFWLAYLLIVLGDTVGDVLHYVIGRYGGVSFLERWGRYIGLGVRHVESLEKMFDGRQGRVFTLGKLAHGFGGALLVAAGLIRMPFDEFLWWNVVGTIPKSLALLALGYYFAHALTKVSSVLDLVASLTVIVGVIAFFVWAYIINKPNRQTR